jgi:hypothetical protein
MIRGLELYAFEPKLAGSWRCFAIRRDFHDLLHGRARQGTLRFGRTGERRLKIVADPVQLYRLIEPGVYDRVVGNGEGSA